MKKEKGKNILIILLLIIIVLLIALIILLVTNNNNLSSKVEINNEKNNETKEIEDNNKTIDAKDTSQNKLTGIYTNKSETENYIHDASIEVTSQTDSSIDFKIEALHGTDIDHVNIGSLTGTATKVNKNTYEYEETILEEQYKILFEFIEDKLIINESRQYPHAGHNVYFSGDYIKEI